MTYKHRAFSSVPDTEGWGVPLSLGGTVLSSPGYAGIIKETMKKAIPLTVLSSGLPHTASISPPDKRVT